MDEPASPEPNEDPLRRPIFVIGPASPAHAAMRESLLAAPGTWDVGSALEGLAGPSGADSAHEVRAALLQAYAARDPTPGVRDATSRMIGFPSDAVAVSSLDAAFPDSVLLYLHQAPEEVLGASGDSSISPEQWVETVTAALDDLGLVARDRWCVSDSADLRREPESEVQRIFAVLDLGWHTSSSAPWRRRGQEAVPGVPPADLPTAVADVLTRVREAIAPVVPSLAPTTAAGSLTAVDDGLGHVLHELGSSLLVSTYQSNRLVVLRHDDGQLGVHLREFDRPMGIEMTPAGFALGVRSEVLDYRDFPAVGENLEPRGRHDACFVPRNSHVTGDIAIHDLGFGRDGLWLVATSFSCLATLDADHSFVPQWRPPFISALAPEDRCHLNGLALIDGVPRYVTALGVSDTAGGWRPDKASGGVLMEVPSGEVLISGLSMPHSPRWHDGRLYVLESGRGRLAVCDLDAGTTEPVVELPGFTRGLSFYGGLAFVGTSQIRETATFGGLPIAALPHRECAVWAIELATGQVVGVVRFQDRIQEIFDVAVAAGRRFPEIVEQNSDLVRTSWYIPARG